MNEASTIIQSAAHEDANIIFGAVLDEKMKDEVKITVIATGFRDVSRRRDASNPVAEVVHNARAAAASVNATYEVPTMREPVSPSRGNFGRTGAEESQTTAAKAPSLQPEPFKVPEAESPRAGERPRAIPYIPDNFDEFESEIVRHAEPKEDTPAREDTSAVETVSSSIDITYDADDLEIPAFLRKRGES